MGATLPVDCDLEPLLIGLVDDVRIYERALSAEEVHTLVRAGITAAIANDMAKKGQMGNIRRPEEKQDEEEEGKKPTPPPPADGN